jgi:hypothetical protein
MGEISVQSFPSVRIPLLKEPYQLRIPEVLVPAKLNSTALINALLASLRASLGGTPNTAVLCHGPLERRGIFSSLSAGFTSDVLAVGYHDYSYYLDTLSRQSQPGAAVFYCRDVRPYNELLATYSRALWDYNPAIAKNCLRWIEAARSDEQMLFPASSSSMRPSLLAPGSGGELFTFNVSTASKLRKLVQSTPFRPDGDELALQPGWGIFAARWEDQSTGAQQAQSQLARLSLSISPEKLSFETIDLMIDVLQVWLEKEQKLAIDNLIKISICAPSLALMGAFTHGLSRYSKKIIQLLTFPDVLHGWSPLNNFFEIWSQPRAKHLLICAGQFPQVHCFLAH